MTVNKNAIPFDPLPPASASGIRVGTPATTSRGFGPDEMRHVGDLLVRTLRHREDAAVLAEVTGEVRAICARFPVPGLPDA
jgi:glycine hydroxymethyltransferase